MALFNATDGPNWVSSDGWGSDVPCARPHWEGVACTPDGTFVSHLALPAHGLDGVIPPELGIMDRLVQLLLNHNQISGGFPPELSNLRALRSLDLSSNQLTGRVPDDILRLRALVPRGLKLSYNGLYTDNPELDEFLDEKSQFDWSATQTVPPSDLQVVQLPDGSMELRWQQIEFSRFTGRYRVAISLQSGGPYKDAGSTPDKLTTQIRITDLSPDTTYYAVVFSETDEHILNNRKVVSTASTEIEFQTTEQTAGFAINPGLNGAWFNTATPGQGFFIDVFPVKGEVFLGWFAYDLELASLDASSVVGHAGHRWLTAQGPFEGQTANLLVNVTRGGLFDAPGEVVTTPIGTMTLYFEDCESGSITYELDTPAISGEIPLSRITDSNVELCRTIAGVNPPASQ